MQGGDLKTQAFDRRSVQNNVIGGRQPLGTRKLRRHDGVHLLRRKPATRRDAGDLHRFVAIDDQNPVNTCLLYTSRCV